MKPIEQGVETPKPEFTITVHNKDGNKRSVRFVGKLSRWEKFCLRLMGWAFKEHNLVNEN